MDDYLKGIAKHGLNQSMLPRWQGAMTSGMEKIYQTIGNLGSIPANWIFASRSKVSPARYDDIAGYELFYDRPIEEISFSNPLLTMGGFSEEASQFQGRSCRFVPLERAILILPLRKPIDIQGEITLNSVQKGTNLQVTLGNEALLKTKLEDNWKSYAFRIPKQFLSAGLNYLNIQQGLPSPQKWSIGRTGRLTSVEITASSAGFFVGNSASFIFAKEIIRESYRGITAYVIDDIRGQFKKIGEFDTFRDINATFWFSSEIKKMPTGSIVALVAKAGASTSWQAQGDEALKSLGASLSLMNTFRVDYALIGVKGAKPGEAVEQLQGNRKVEITVGRPPETRFSGVAWGTLSMRPFISELGKN